MIGTPPSNTQITESFSVNLLARPNTIFLVIGDAHNAAAVYDGDSAKARISGGNMIRHAQRITEESACACEWNAAKEIII